MSRIPTRTLTASFLLLVTTCFCLCVHAEIRPAADAPQPLSPEESASRIRLPEGFRLELVASEPIVQEPSAITFDEWGRLFVCELHGYNVEGHIDTQELNKTGTLDKKVRRLRWEIMGGETADKAAEQQYGVLKLLSDRDGDGRMDHAEIWADDLPPCYGVVAARGGVLVTSAPHIIFFADRDGDGKPDVRQTLYTGFGIHVLERGINNPIWGLDDWIYVGSGGDGGTITGPHLAHAVSLGGSDFRIKADGTAIEPVNGRVGTFGMTMNAIGDRFPSSGGRPAIYALLLPYHYLKRNPFVPTPQTNHTASPYNRGYRISEPHPWRVRRGEDPAWVKFYGKTETTSIYFSGGCSTTYYGDRLFPEAYHGNLFYCEPSLNIVHRCLLEREGAGYRARRAPNEETSEFLASTDQWFRPMNLRIGPYGELYIVDMYREIIEDYSAIPRYLQQQYGLDKGKAHGRLWRLLPEEAPSKSAPNLHRLPSTDLARLIAHPSHWHRQTAKRLLAERRDQGDGVKVLKTIAQNPDTHANGIVTALHTLATMNALASEDLTPAFSHADHAVRVHALRLAEPFLGKNETTLLTTVLAMADDPDPRVRLQLALTLGEAPSARATNTLASLVKKHGSDRWLDTAILSSCHNDMAVPLLAEILSPPDISEAARALVQPLATTVGGLNEPTSIASVLAHLATAAEDSVQINGLKGLMQGLPSNATVSSTAAAALRPNLATLVQSTSAAVRLEAVTLATGLGLADSPEIASMFDRSVDQALDAQQAFEDRRDALTLLALAPHAKLEAVAGKTLHPSQAPQLQLATVEALDASPHPNVASTLLQGWITHGPSTRQAILEALLSRANRHSKLVEAIENGTIRASAISSVQQEKLSASSDASLARRAQSLFTPETDAELERRIERYQEALGNPRDITNGEKVFRTTCLTCHQLGNEGKDIGPALGSLTTRPDESILLDLLDPSGKIDPEYALYVVINQAGETFAGILAAESATSLTVQQSDGSRAVVLRKDIASMTSTPISLMPNNLHEAISPQAASDLIGFLRVAYGSKTE